MLSTKAPFQAALNSQNQATNELFGRMASELRGLAASYADSTGKIPPQKWAEFRQKAGDIVRSYFVTTRPATPAERQTERARLTELIQQAQKDARRGKNDRQRKEAGQRVILLSKRLAELEQGRIVVSIDEQGRAYTPFAQSLMDDMRELVNGVMDTHQKVIERALRPTNR